MGGAKLIDLLTQKIFGLPQDEAVENAYRFLGLKLTATNMQINTAYRKLAFKYHPDKGGDQEKFLLLHQHIEIIRVHREEQTAKQPKREPRKPLPLCDFNEQHLK